MKLVYAIIMMLFVLFSNNVVAKDVCPNGVTYKDLCKGKVEEAYTNPGVVIPIEKIWEYSPNGFYLTPILSQIGVKYEDRKISTVKNFIAEGEQEFNRFFLVVGISMIFFTLAVVIKSFAADTYAFLATVAAFISHIFIPAVGFTTFTTFVTLAAAGVLTAIFINRFLIAARDTAPTYGYIPGKRTYVVYESREYSTKENKIILMYYISAVISMTSMYFGW